MLTLMPPRHLPIRRSAVLAMLVCGAHVMQGGLHGEQSSPKPERVAPIAIQGLGKGTVALNGPWQFHPGDDPAWASPVFDSSKWEQVTADEPWGLQGHAHLTGFG